MNYQHHSSALDIGCGNGLLSAELRGRVPEVTGIDLDEGVLGDARRQAGDRITWVRGDAMSYEFGRQFDVVASVATLHHMPDFGAALSRLADLTAPGGVLAVVGTARTSHPKDVLLHMAGAVQHRWMARKHEFWEHTAPTIWPPPHDYVAVRRTAERVLPLHRLVFAACCLNGASGAGEIARLCCPNCSANGSLGA